MSARRLLLTVAAAAVLADARGAAPPAPAYAEVAGIFNSRCTACHSGASAPLGVRLDSYEAVLAGGKKRPVVIPGAPQSSELVRRIRGESLPRMPLTGPPYLSDAEIALMVAWIEAGAPRGAQAPPAAKPTATAPPPPDAPVTYAHIEPILLSRCVKCHVESGGQMGRPPEGYVLRTYDQTLAAGERVRVVPGNPAASELLRRVKGTATPRMPFDGPPWLTHEEIALIERWIAEGARNRDGERAPVPVGAQVRLRGTLTAPRAIDGASFTLDAARTEGNLRTGASAELRGVVQADGGIRATRVRAR